MFSFIPTPVQGPLLALISGIFYYLFFIINIKLFNSWAIYGQGIALIFLPAGVKHIAILLAGWWGALGCFAALFLMALDFWSGQPSLVIAFYCAISTASTWIAIVSMLRVLGISSNLENLRFFHLPLIDLVTTAVHGFLTNTYFAIAGMKTENFVDNALAMMFGDFVGCFILLTIFWLLVILSKKYRVNTTTT